MPVKELVDSLTSHNIKYVRHSRHLSRFSYIHL